MLIKLIKLLKVIDINLFKIHAKCPISFSVFVLSVPLLIIYFDLLAGVKEYIFYSLYPENAVSSCNEISDDTNDDKNDDKGGFCYSYNEEILLNPEINKKDLLLNLEQFNQPDLANVDTMLSLYTHSIPNLKLFYPEAFIATGNFLHNDIWFIHISLYQYWLWFFFIFLIIFFTISFLTTIRWCTLRSKPQRETRGVSRSKCGDLITAAVPVTWASSIIVHESTDAIDSNDGFGTAEMAVGIRAYQWGWEYYYPKDVDLMYTTTSNESFYVGNSTSLSTEDDDLSNDVISFLENFKVKNNWDSTITPAHLVCTPTNFYDDLSYNSTNNFGFSKLTKENSFKHILNGRYINYDLLLGYKHHLKTLPRLLLPGVTATRELTSEQTPTLHKKQHELMSTSSYMDFRSALYDLKPLMAYKKHLIETRKQNFKNFINKFILHSNKIIHNEDYNFHQDQFDYLFSVIKEDFEIWWPYAKRYFHLGQKSQDSDVVRSFLIEQDVSLYQEKETKSGNRYDYSSYNFIKNTLKNVYYMIIPKEVTIDYDKIYNLELSRNVSIDDQNYEKLVLNSKKLNIDSENVTKFNFIKLDINSNLLSTNISTINKIDTLSSLLHYPNTLPKIYAFSSLNWPNQDIISNQLFTKVISSNYKTPFKLVRMNSNTYLINNFNTNNQLTSVSDKWNNDYYYSDFITQQSKTNFTPIRQNHQLTIYQALINLKQLAPSYFEHSVIKRLQSLADLTTLIYESVYDTNSTSDSYNYIFDFESNLPGSQVFENNSIQIDYSFSDEDLLFFTTDIDSDEWDRLKRLKSEKMFNFKSIIYRPDSILNKFYDNSTTLLKNKYYTHTSYITKINLNYFITNNLLNDIIVNSFVNFKELFILNNSLKVNNFLNLNLSSFTVEHDLLLTKYWSEADIQNINTTVNSLFSNEFIRFNSNKSILDSIKTLMQSENSLNKFYKNVFDDNKSFIDFSNFSSSKKQLPHINFPEAGYKALMSKDGTSILKTNLYSSKNNDFINYLANQTLATSMFMFEFPFTLAKESDLLKFSWFDWYSSYNVRITKAQDLSEYLLNGSQMFSNKYDFSSSEISNYNNKDNYLSRLSHSRKNYLSSWNYTPFNLMRFKEWSYNTFLNELVSIYTNKHLLLNIENSTKFIFLNDVMGWIDDSFTSLSFNKKITFIGSNTGLITNTRNYYRNSNTLSSYAYTISSLQDILTKREYLLNQHLLFNNKFSYLLNNYTVTPYNPIIISWKSSILNQSNIETDLVRYNFSEYWLKLLKEYDIIYKITLKLKPIITSSIPTLPYYRFCVKFNEACEDMANDVRWLASKVKPFVSNKMQVQASELISELNSTVNDVLKTTTNYKNNIVTSLKTKVTTLRNSVDNNISIKPQTGFYKKSQYKHMRKSMANMIRIQNDKAVALPVDTRIQLLTVSKDIIHSWAIPSAGIKIDCIPGYSSHKITIFFLSGIYWGQCMEICGRYHHWMPIVVYFMKRDLFLLWCIHFVSSNKKNNSINSVSTIRNNNDIIYSVSYPTSSWIKELQK